MLYKTERKAITIQSNVITKKKIILLERTQSVGIIYNNSCYDYWKVLLDNRLLIVSLFYFYVLKRDQSFEKIDLCCLS